MYDTIKCEYPFVRPDDVKELADIEFTDLIYQTKDLDCALDSYLIKRDRTLWKRNSYIPNDGDWVQILHTGVINFYDYYINDEFKNDYWIEYSATFVNGFATRVDIVKFEAADNTERKAISLKFDDSIKRREILWSKWYMKYGYKYYDKFIAFVFKKWYTIKNKLPNAYIVEHWLRPL